MADETVSYSKEHRAKALLHCMSLATSLLTEMISLHSIFRSILALTSSLLQGGGDQYEDSAASSA